MGFRDRNDRHFYQRHPQIVGQQQAQKCDRQASVQRIGRSRGIPSDIVVNQRMGKGLSVKTIYITKDKTKVIHTVKNKHHLIYTALNYRDHEGLSIVRTPRHPKENIAFILSPEEFAALPDGALKGAKVVRE